MTFNLTVSLKDMYTGTTKRIKINRNVKCNGCCGFGIKTCEEYKDGLIECGDCQGRGMKHQLVNLGFLQLQQQIKCVKCKGSGIPDQAKCIVCQGNKFTKGETILEVHIEKGSKSGIQIVFEEKGDECDLNVPGDVIVTIIEETSSEISLFERHSQNSDNLVYKKTISLCDALTGYDFTIEHLDGRKIHLVGNDIINPQYTKIIKGEGMTSTSDLHIIFIIKFPSELSQNTKNVIRSVLSEHK